MQTVQKGWGISHILVGVLMFGIAGCATVPPTTFIQVQDTANTGWKTIELREGLTYDEAWQVLVDTVAIKYDIETTDKEAGYLRSAWQYMTGRDQGTGEPFSYGRRLACKFAPDKKSFQIKTEAYYEVRNWPTVYGLDSAFNQDVFTAIAGKLGRTTR